MSRRRSATLTAVTAVATVLTLASAAGAATIEVVGGAAVFTAAPGEVNDVRAGTRANPDPPDGRTLKVTDTGATLKAGAGCERIDDHNAWCPEPQFSGIPLIMRMGDRDDRVFVDDRFDRVVNVRGEGGDDNLHVGSSVGASPVLDGGTGDDVLSTATNNSGIPVLRGGSGDDELALDEARGGQAIGGDGDDRVRYTGSFSTDPGTLRLDGGDGNDVYTYLFGFVPTAMQPGPGIDTLDQSDLAFPHELVFNMADCPGCVEIVLGSSLDDVITGDRRAQAIFGGEGDDQLDGGDGPDILSGQAGDDTLRSRDNSIDVVRCGDGADTLTSDRRDLISRTCESIVR
jgi:Ca2+-binding RTX toxin-like protein